MPDLEILRHSTSHVMAQAVKELFPGAKLGIGPSIDDGFYYDFELPAQLIPEDLVKIENKMQEIVKADQKFERLEISKEEAAVYLEREAEKFKLELLKEMPDEKVSLYRNGTFVDLCRGPHLESTGQIKVFKLLPVVIALLELSKFVSVPNVLKTPESLSKKFVLVYDTLIWAWEPK